jgi:hypothetical protein
MKSVHHPPHLPDLGPSDFSLFACAKGYLADRSFESKDEFLEAVRRVVIIIKSEFAGSLS